MIIDSSWIDPPTAAEMVLEFHELFGLAIDAEPTLELRELRHDLLCEELDEVTEELTPEYSNYYPKEFKERLAKELADLVYVTYGTAISLGIDLDEAIRRVHLSNMSKLGPDGEPIRREDGKVLKGPDYFEPDMKGVAG